MKKVILLLLICFSSLCLTGCTSKEPKDLLSKIKLKNKIVIGIKNDSKPFGYIENGELKGFDVDIAKSVSRRILGDTTGELIEFIYVTPESRIIDLNSSKVDIIIATMSVNANRSHVVDFTAPYFVAGQALLVPDGSKVNSMESLNTRRVGVILGTTGERTIRQLAPNATIIGKKTYDDTFNMLKENKVDAILADDSILYGFIIDKKGYKILPARYTKEYYAIALRKGKETESLKEELNKHLDYMQQSGRLNRIKEKWIPNLHIN